MTRVRCTPDGVEYEYKPPELGATGIAVTAAGGVLTGLLGVGVGKYSIRVVTLALAIAHSGDACIRL
jgi:hypothetical protein